MTHYDKLGVPNTSTPEQVKRAYRKKARTSHPDAGGSHEDMKEVNAAYSCLRDPERRRLYDSTGCDEQAMDERKRVEATLVGMFKDCVTRNIEPERILDAIQTVVEQKRETSIRDIARLKARQEELMKYQKAIVARNGGSEIFAAATDDLIASLGAQLAQIEQYEKGCGLMLDLLKEYRCGVAPAVPLYDPRAGSFAGYADFSWGVSG